MKKKYYAIVESYHGRFIKNTKYDNGLCKPNNYCKNFYEIPKRTKKDAIAICNNLNSGDFFSNNGAKMFNVIEIKEIKK